MIFFIMDSNVCLFLFKKWWVSFLQPMLEITLSSSTLDISPLKIIAIIGSASCTQTLHGESVSAICLVWWDLFWNCFLIFKNVKKLSACNSYPKNPAHVKVNSRFRSFCIHVSECFQIELSSSSKIFLLWCSNNKRRAHEFLCWDIWNSSLLNWIYCMYIWDFKAEALIQADWLLVWYV